MDTQKLHRDLPGPQAADTAPVVHLSHAVDAHLDLYPCGAVRWHDTARSHELARVTCAGCLRALRGAS